MILHRNKRMTKKQTHALLMQNNACVPIMQNQTNMPTILQFQPFISYTMNILHIYTPSR